MTQFIEEVARILHLPATAVSKLLTTIGVLLVLWLLRWVWLWIMARRTEVPKPVTNGEKQPRTLLA